jgi:hypothetical protein
MKSMITITKLEIRKSTTILEKHLKKYPPMGEIESKHIWKKWYCYDVDWEDWIKSDGIGSIGEALI